jgi:hypothetical protein
MKILLKVFLLIAILNQGCGLNKKSPNQFSSSSDTLLIRTEKHKGDGLFSLGVIPLVFKDTIEDFSHPVIFPKQITNIKRIEMSTDFWAEKAHYIDIMNGSIGKKAIFIVDENNNKDFTDDSIRLYKPVKWRSADDLIKCKYLISDGQKIVEDSSWIRIGTLSNDLWYGRSEHLIANFTINKEEFKVGIIDIRAGCFVYGVFPEIALLSNNSESKDTIFQKDILQLGEFLNLNGNYYRFENITNNGDFITLTKEKNFDKKIGTQVGMIAPEFICKTVAGDTVSSLALHDKIMVIANSCGCGDDRLSTEAYYNMKKKYANNIHILRLDSKIDKGLEGLQIDVAEEFNSDIYNKYRREYCSRMCYVIDKNNRIIDKFPVSQWKSDLPKHIKL